MKIETAMSAISANMAEYKERTGMSDKQLAEKMGFERKMVTDLRNGRKNGITLRTMLIMCDEMGLTLTELCGEGDG